MRSFQHLKTLFCKGLLSSNMQICYPRRKYETKNRFGVFKTIVFDSFLPLFSLRITNVHV